MKSIPYERVSPAADGEPFFDLVTNPDDFARFGPSLVQNPVVGGEVPTRADVLAVVFDLEGFTRFCSQRDPQTFVPRFVGDFTDWFFQQIRSQLLFHSGGPAADSVQTEDGKYQLCAPPPFFAKFLGDGFLCLWAADRDLIRRDLPDDADEGLVENELRGDLTNTLAVIQDVRRSYSDYQKTLREHYVNVPSRLRLGAAVGLVTALSNGRDFVGPCINQASRLEKLGPLGMAVDCAGFPNAFVDAPGLERMFTKQTVDIRGGEQTRVLVDAKEWDSLTEEEQRSITSKRD